MMCWRLLAALRRSSRATNAWKTLHVRSNARSIPKPASSSTRPSRSGRDRRPTRDAAFMTNVPGCFIIGDVSGTPLIKNAANEGADVIKHIADELRNGAAPEPKAETGRSHHRHRPGRTVCRDCGSASELALCRHRTGQSAFDHRSLSERQIHFFQTRHDAFARQYQRRRHRRTARADSGPMDRRDEPHMAWSSTKAKVARA